MSRGTLQRRAHEAVEAAIKDGTLQQEPCELCGATETLAHHDDYDRPLDVRWLCRRDHTLVHNALNVNRPPDPSIRLGEQISARAFRESFYQLDEPVTVLRNKNGEWLKLGFWIPARKTQEGTDG